MAKQDLVKLLKDVKAREFESLVVGERVGRRDAGDMPDWKRRISESRDLYAGNYPVVFPGEFVQGDVLFTSNLVQVGMDDIKDLVSESLPVIRCDPFGKNQGELENANLREAIALGYWLQDDYLSWLPSQLALDLAGTGGAFLLVWTEPGEEYPRLIRLDPMGVFPDIVQGQMQDCLVVTRLKLRQAARLFADKFPRLETDAGNATEVDVVDYYSPEFIGQVLVYVDGSKQDEGELVWAMENPIGEVPIAWAKLETFDGQWRGLFDQVKDTMVAENRIATLLVDYAEQLINSPFQEKGVVNAEDPPGPKTVYHVDPTVEGGGMSRVQPAGSHPQVFALLEWLERQSRSGMSYPATRQGEISQNIASAAFVTSTMGQLTTKIRALQRHLARLMSRANELAFSIDETLLNKKKPLFFPLQETAEYKPRDDIGGRHRNRIIFGAFAGLDMLNRSTLLLHDLGAGLISKETAAEQKDYILSPKDEVAKRESELLREAILQRAAGESDFPTLLALGAKAAEGKTVLEAAKELHDEAMAQAEQLAAEQTAETPVPTEVVPPEEQVPVEPTEPKLPLPPSTQVIVAPPRVSG